MEAYWLFASLLEYPSPGMPAALDACIRSLSNLPEPAGLLQEFRTRLEALGLDRLEEIYTDTFDMQEEHALYIGHHVLGEDWRRSVLMTSLKQRYREEGFSSGTEMPDHLSVILRYLGGRQPSQESEELISACVVPAISKVLRGLDAHENPYCAVLRALLLSLQQQDTWTARNEEN